MAPDRSQTATGILWGRVCASFASIIHSTEPPSPAGCRGVAPLFPAPVSPKAQSTASPSQRRARCPASAQRLSTDWGALVQIDANRIVGIQRSCDGDQDLREICENPPIMALVGVGQRRARYLAAQPHVVELAGYRPQARFDIAQALAVSQLRKGHCQILVQTREASQVRVAAIAGHALLELVFGQVLHELGEDG